MNDIQNNFKIDLPLHFSRVKQGYSPEEVDVVIDTQRHKIEELKQKNDELQEQNSCLMQALGECNTKIKQLAQTTHILNDERQKEKQRLANVMLGAGKTAEEIVLQARQKAKEIIADATIAVRQYQIQVQENAKAAREEFASLSSIVRSTRESSIGHYDKLDEIFSSAVDFLDISQFEPPAPTYEHSASAVSAETFERQAAPQKTEQTDGQELFFNTDPVKGQQFSDPYEEYLKTMGLSHEQSDKPKAQGKVIGSFGSMDD